MIIGVDIDLTIVDTLTPWIEWYKKLTGNDLKNDVVGMVYNIEDLMKSHRDPLEFWRRPDLYDDLEPIPDAVEVLNELKRQGHTIIFISSCFPEHENSKRYFLQRNFDFDGFISTSDKHFVKCDHFIDDYNKYLDKIKDFYPDTKTFRINTILNENNPSKHATGDWYDFLRFVKGDKKIKEI